MRIAATGRRKLHLHHQLLLRLGADEIGEDGAVDRVTLGLQHIQREGDVPGGQLRAVMKARLRAQLEAIGQLVRADAHGLRHEAIERIGLVGAARHEAVEGGVDARRAIALEDIDVEGVEGLEILVAGGVLDLDDQRSTLGRPRVHIGEMLKVRRLLQLAEGGEPMGAGFSALSACGAKARQREGAQACGGCVQQAAAGQGHGRGISFRGAMRR